MKLELRDYLQEMLRSGTHKVTEKLRHSIPPKYVQFKNFHASYYFLMPQSLVINLSTNLSLKKFISLLRMKKA